MAINDAFNYYETYQGQYAGDQVGFNILRPNYSQSDNTPVLVANNVILKEDVGGNPFSEPHLSGVQFYNTFADRTLFLPGDIIQRSIPDNMTPIITVAHYLPLKGFISFRTTRTCNLTNKLSDVIYSNVYFDFTNEGHPGSSTNERLEDSLKIPHAKVVIFKRDNIFRLRTMLVETDSTAQISKDGGELTQYQRKWLVEEIFQTGNFMILTLSNAINTGS